MMVSLQYFLIIMTVLFPIALSAENISCTNETQLAPWDACCNGVIYDRTDPIWMEESCNIEPKTANLSFADSAWLAYDCNVREQLNSTSLTLQSYINLMLLPRDSVQSTFWETLTSRSSISEITSGEDELDRIQTIKLYRREFFQVAEQVCTFGSENSTHGNAELDDATYVDFEESSSGIQISEPCNEEMLPFSAYFAGNPNFNATYEPFEKCTEEFNRLLGISTFISFQSSAFTFCQAIAVQNLDKVQGQILKHTLNFEGTVTSFFPAFWSKWVKDEVKNSIFEALKQDLNINTQNLKNLESKMRGNIEKKIKRDLSKDGKLGKKREIVNIIMILKINDVFQDFAANVCKFDAPRKQNAGV